MAKVTTYHCDFNPNLPAHQAQFRVFGKGSQGETVVGDKDSCSDHVLQIAATVLNRGGEVTVRAITEGDIVVPHVEYEAKVKGGRTNSQRTAPSSLMRGPCPECGQELSYSEFITHLPDKHNWGIDIAKNARAEAMEAWKAEHKSE